MKFYLLGLLFVAAVSAGNAESTAEKPPDSYWWGYCEARDTSQEHSGQCKDPSFEVVADYCIYLDTAYVNSWGYSETCSVVAAGANSCNGQTSGRRKKRNLARENLVTPYHARRKNSTRPMYDPSVRYAELHELTDNQKRSMELMERQKPRIQAMNDMIAARKRKRQTLYLLCCTYFFITWWYDLSYNKSLRVNYYYEYSYLYELSTVTYLSRTVTHSLSLSSVAYRRTYRYHYYKGYTWFRLVTTYDTVCRMVSSSHSWYNKLNLGMMRTAFIPYYGYFKAFYAQHTDCCADTGNDDPECMVPDHLSGIEAGDANDKEIVMYTAFMTAPFTQFVAGCLIEPYHMLVTSKYDHMGEYTVAYARTPQRMRSIWTFATYTTGTPAYMNGRTIPFAYGSGRKRDEQLAIDKRKAALKASKKRGLIATCCLIATYTFVTYTHFRVHTGFGGRVAINQPNGASDTMCETFCYGYNCYAVPYWFTAMYAQNFIMFDSWYNKYYLHTNGASAKSNMQELASTMASVASSLNGVTPSS